MNIQVIAGLLKRTKMTVDAATSGASCLEKLENRDYDLIFMDYRMPEMDGVETLHRLRELYPEKTRDLPVICLTASAVSSTREFMLSAGFTDYLSKPVVIEEMENALLTYLPPEKVIRGGDAEKEPPRPKSVLPPELYEISLLDTAQGIRFCGDATEYRNALTIYARSIDEKADELESSLNAEDWKNYTIRVHALKSTSRSVGATEISELAAELEKAGNAADAEAIRRDTPRLLSLYRSLREPLGRLFDAPEAAELPPLPEDEYADAIASLRDLSAAFDYDSVCMVMGMLDRYAIPQAHRDACKRLRAAVDHCDWDAINAVLEEEET